MSMNIEDEAMKKLMAEAFLKAMPQELRDKLIRDALASIFQSKATGRWGEQTSTVQEAFSNVARQVAEDECRKIIKESPEFKAGIESITRKAVARLFSDEEFATTVAMTSSEAVRKAIANARFE